jgi:hypothetical protein
MRHRATRVFAVVAAMAVGVLACARAYPPTGGERDTLAPRLVSTEPAALAVVPGYTGAAVFRFDERISERNFSEALTVVSPLDSAVRIERAGREVRVRIDGGWRPGRIYRVVLLPGLRDLFGNVRSEPAEIVFSTGPDIPATAIAGIVMDRITGGAAQNGVVTATRQGDDAAYMAVADSVGFFSLRHVPPGAYDLLAFADLNRNRRRDRAEPVDSGTVAQLTTQADTVTVVFNVLPADTSPPRVTRAESVDSLHVRISFDDYFDTGEAFEGTGAEVHSLPDSVSRARGQRFILAPVFEREQAAAAAARADSIAAMEPDSVALVEADTAIAAPRARAAPRTRATERPLLPSRDIVVELDRALQPGQAYTITVAGAVNISGLAGGGVARFEARAAPPPARDPVPADTIPTDTIPTDTIPTDTIPTDTIPTDTGPPPVDTIGRRRR